MKKIETFLFLTLKISIFTLMDMNIYTDEIKFCVKYLHDRGIVATNYEELSALVDDLNLEFDLVRIQRNRFDELAEKLREMWPAGSKDGMYEWRGNVPELSKRLKLMWEDRFPKKKVDIDECLTVARRYLSRYEENTRFMQTLKYFIIKRKEIVQKDGKVKYVYESKFADMLEGKNDEDAVQNEWDALLRDGSLGEGELI